MLRYIVRRVLWGIALLFIVSAAVFLMFYILPTADPAVLRAGRNAGPAQIAQIRHALGLDKPIYTQFWVYMRNVFLHFDFSYSYQYNVPVRQLIFSRLPPTILLVTGAVILWLAVGITVGVISAVRRRTVLDRMAMGGALLFISVPVYWLGLVCLYLFSNDIGVVHIFDGSGSYTGLTADPVQWFNSLLLPWMVLAASFAAFYSRLLRSNLVETMSEDGEHQIVAVWSRDVPPKPLPLILRMLEQLVDHLVGLVVDKAAVHGVVLAHFVVP